MRMEIWVEGDHSKGGLEAVWRRGFGQKWNLVVKMILGLGCVEWRTEYMC